MMNSIEIANNLDDIDKIYHKWVKAGKKICWTLGGSAGLEIDYKNRPDDCYPYYYRFNKDTDEYEGRFVPDILGVIK